VLAAWRRRARWGAIEVIDVSFDAIRDPKECAYVMNLPTSFVFPPQDIDRLREVAGRLMRHSTEHGEFARELGGASASSVGAPAP
jgi:hypothetical protein